METNSATSTKQSFGALFLYRFCKTLDREWKAEQPICNGNLDKTTLGTLRECWVAQKIELCKAVMEWLKQEEVKISDIRPQVEACAIKGFSNSFDIPRILGEVSHEVNQNFQLAGAYDSLKQAEVLSKVQKISERDQVDICWFLNRRKKQSHNPHFDLCSCKEIEKIQEPHRSKLLTSSLKKTERTARVSFATRDQIYVFSE